MSRQKSGTSSYRDYLADVVRDDSNEVKTVSSSEDLLSAAKDTSIISNITNASNHTDNNHNLQDNNNNNDNNKNVNDNQENNNNNNNNNININMIHQTPASRSSRIPSFSSSSGKGKREKKGQLQTPTIDTASVSVSTPTSSFDANHANNGYLSPFSPVLKTPANRRELSDFISLRNCRKVSVVVKVGKETSDNQRCVFAHEKRDEKAKNARNLIVVKPSAFGKQIPSQVTMETARLVAQVAHISSEDWARSYEFHHVVWPDNTSTMPSLARAAARDAVVDRKSSVLISMGESHSVLGTQGLLSDILSIISTSMKDEQTVVCAITMMEIDHADFRDLLDRKNNAKIQLRHKDSKGAIVLGLAQVTIDSMPALLESISKRKRRGHVVCSISFWPNAVHHELHKDPMCQITCVELFPRPSNSQRKSISTLGQALRGLLLQSVGTEPFGSYRESNITKVLQRTLHKSQVVLIASISPMAQNYDTTLATLSYAHRLTVKPGITATSPYRSFERDAVTDDDRPELEFGGKRGIAAPKSLEQYAGDKYLLKQIVSDPRQRLARVFSPQRTPAAKAPPPLSPTPNLDLNTSSEDYEPTDYMQTFHRKQPAPRTQLQQQEPPPPIEPEIDDPANAPVVWDYDDDFDDNGDDEDPADDPHLLDNEPRRDWPNNSNNGDDPIGYRERPVPTAETPRADPDPSRRQHEPPPSNSPHRGRVESPNRNLRNLDPPSDPYMEPPEDDPRDDDLQWIDDMEGIDPEPERNQNEPFDDHLRHWSNNGEYDDPPQNHHHHPDEPEQPRSNYIDDFGNDDGIIGGVGRDDGYDHPHHYYDDYEPHPNDGRHQDVGDYNDDIGPPQSDQLPHDSPLRFDTYPVPEDEEEQESPLKKYLDNPTDNIPNQYDDFFLEEEQEMNDNPQVQQPPPSRAPPRHLPRHLRDSDNPHPTRRPLEPDNDVPRNHNSDWRGWNPINGPDEDDDDDHTLGLEPQVDYELPEETNNHQPSTILDNRRPQQSHTTSYQHVTQVVHEERYRSEASYQREDIRRREEYNGSVSSSMGPGYRDNRPADFEQPYPPRSRNRDQPGPTTAGGYDTPSVSSTRTPASNARKPYRQGYHAKDSSPQFSTPSGRHPSDESYSSEIRRANENAKVGTGSQASSSPARSRHGNNSNYDTNDPNVGGRPHNADKDLYGDNVPFDPNNARTPNQPRRENQDEELLATVKHRNYGYNPSLGDDGNMNHPRGGQSEGGDGGPNDDIQALEDVVDQIKAMHSGLWKSSTLSLYRLRENQESQQRKLIAVTTEKDEVQVELELLKKELLKKSDDHRKQADEYENELRDLREQLEKALGDRNAVEKIAEDAISTQDSLEKKVKSLKDELLKCRTEAANNHDEARRAHEKQKELRSELESTQGRVQNLERENKDRNKLIAELELSVNRLESERERLVDSKSSDQSKIDELRKEVSRMEQSRKAVEEERSRIDDQHRKDKLQLDRLEDEMRRHKNSLESLTIERNQLVQSRRDDQSLMDSLKEEIRRLKLSVESLEKEKKQLEELRRDDKARIEHLQAELRKFGNMQLDLEQYENDLSKLQQEKTEMESDIERRKVEFMKEIHERDEKLLRYRVEYENLENEFSSLRDRERSYQSNAGSKIKNLEDRIGELQSELYTTRRERDDVLVRIESYESRHTEFSHDLRQRDEIVDKLKREIQHWKAELTDARDRERSLQSNADRDIRELETKVSDLQTELSISRRNENAAASKLESDSHAWESLTAELSKVRDELNRETIERRHLSSEVTRYREENLRYERKISSMHKTLERFQHETKYKVEQVLGNERASSQRLEEALSENRNLLTTNSELETLIARLQRERDLYYKTLTLGRDRISELGSRAANLHVVNGELTPHVVPDYNPPPSARRTKPTDNRSHNNGKNDTGMGGDNNGIDQFHDEYKTAQYEDIGDVSGMIPELSANHVPELSRPRNNHDDDNNTNGMVGGAGVGGDASHAPTELYLSTFPMDKFMNIRAEEIAACLALSAKNKIEDTQELINQWRLHANKVEEEKDAEVASLKAKIKYLERQLLAGIEEESLRGGSRSRRHY